MPADSTDAHQKMRVMGLRVTVEQDEFLDRVARRRGVPKSIYMRQLINQDMDSDSGHSPLTAA